jgi:CelD/BcsL family acetyltransferase involved in cellulose biosynthesis
MIYIEEINNLDGIENIRNDWHRLIELNINVTVFQTYEWIHTWWQFNHKYGNMRTIVVKKNNNIIGIAPLMLSAAKVLGIPYKSLSFASPQSDYNDFIYIPQERDEFYNAIIEYLYNIRNLWNIVTLKHIPPESATIEKLIDVGKRNNMLCFSYISSSCPYVDIKQSWEKYYERVIGKKLRYNMDRQLRNLQKRSSTSIVHYSRDISLDRVMNIIFEITRRSYKSRSGNPIFDNETNRNFYIAIAERFYENGWLDIVYLKTGEIPISYHYGFKFRKKYYYYNLAYDESYSKYSPGMLLLKELIKESFQDGYNEFDFLRGDELYKSDWATEYRKNYAIEFVNKDVFSKLCYRFDKYIEAVIKPRILKITMIVRIRNALKWIVLHKYRGHRWIDYD